MISDWTLSKTPSLLAAVYTAEAYRAGRPNRLSGGCGEKETNSA